MERKQLLCGDFSPRIHRLHPAVDSRTACIRTAQCLLGQVVRQLDLVLKLQVPNLLFDRGESHDTIIMTQAGFVNLAGEMEFYRILSPLELSVRRPLTNPCQPVNLIVVNRIVAALLLLLWTGSVSRCLAEQYGLLHEMPGLECCDHGHDHHDDHDSDEHLPTPEPGHSHSNPCGICHMIEHGGVNFAKQVVVGEVALLPITQIELPVLDSITVLKADLASISWLRPPIRLRWGAFLIVTCLPVRGPNVAC